MELFSCQILWILSILDFNSLSGGMLPNTFSCCGQALQTTWAGSWGHWALGAGFSHLCGWTLGATHHCGQALGALDLCLSVYEPFSSTQFVRFCFAFLPVFWGSPEEAASVDVVHTFSLSRSGISWLTFGFWFFRAIKCLWPSWVSNLPSTIHRSCCFLQCVFFLCVCCRGPAAAVWVSVSSILFRLLPCLFWGLYPAALVAATL